MPVAYHQSFKHSDSARIPSLCQAQRAGPPHPRPAQSLGSGHPCPGSETLFLVLTRRGWRAGFWSWVAWVPVRGHLSGHVTWDKSLHFLTCAMGVAIVPVSRGFWPSLNSRQPTHTSTFLCLQPLSMSLPWVSIKHLPVPSTENKHPPQTQIHILACLMHGAA